MSSIVDIKGLVQDSKIGLQKQSTDAFGSFADNLVRGGLNNLKPGANSTGAPGSMYDPKSWYATSYAAGLSGASGYRPKLKFLFKVQFVFTTEAKKLQPSLQDNFTFMVKSVDRPKITFEYEEDMNLYNFKTKALRRIQHQDLTIVFMDDTGNKVIDFFRMMMMIQSPITANQLDRDGKLELPKTNLKMKSGMAFNRSKHDSAIRAAVNSDYGNILDAIRVQQIYVNPSHELNRAVQMVSFDYMNPRIVSFDLDELTHESSDPNTLTMMFSYDWLEVVKVGTLGTADAPYSSLSVADVKPGGITNAPSEITPYMKTGAPKDSPAGGNNAAGGSIIESLVTGSSSAVSGALARTGQRAVSDAINRTVSSVAGNGSFASAIGSTLSSATSGAIGSIVQGAARDAIGSVTNTAGVYVQGIGSSVRTSISSALKDFAKPTGSASAVSPVDGRPRGGA